MQAFPASRRLRQPEEYDLVFKQAEHRVTGQAFVLLALQRGKGQQGRGPSRLGLVIGRKAVAKAVKRNRLKRLVREAFRKADLGMAGLDLVFLVRQTKGGKAMKAMDPAAWPEAVAAVFAILQGRVEQRAHG